MTTSDDDPGQAGREEHGPLPARDEPSIAAAIADLADRLGMEADAIELVEYRDVTWPDGSLGCPKPGMSYLQRLTDGLLLVLSAGGRRFEYHAGPTGKLVYCATPRPPIGGRGARAD